MYDIFPLDVPPRTYRPGHFPHPDNFAHQLRHPHAAAKTNILKLALTHTLDSNLSTTWGPDPSRPMRLGFFFRKLTLTHILALSAVNFVHVNRRSLYIADWRTVVVEGGNVKHHVKKRGIVQEGEMSGGYIMLPKGVLSGGD